MVLGLLGGLAVYLLLPGEVDELSRRAAGIFVVGAMFWAGRVLPLYATSLGVVIASIVLLAEQGGLAPEGGIEAAIFLEPFASNIMMLFFGGLVLSVALSKHGVDRVIAMRLLRPLAHRPLALLYAVMGLTAFLSMWMSNTATTAMMLAVVGSQLRDVDRGDRTSTAMVLGVAMGANIGGVGTPIGTPPNAIAMAALQSAGFEVTFFRWMVMAVPLAAGLLAVAGLVIYRLYRPTGEGMFEGGESDDPRPVSLDRSGWMTVGVMVLAVGAWLTSGLHGIADGVVALGVVFALSALGLVGAGEIRKIEWPTLILMWGGLALGVAMNQTGLVGYMAGLGVEDLRPLFLAALLMTVAVGLSMFISNTATAALLMPLVMAPAMPTSGLLAVLVGLSCSFAMAMPVSTPPNALAYGTGRVGMADLAKTGGLMAAIAFVIVLAGYRLVIPLAMPVGG